MYPMPVLELTEDQVVELVRQLRPECQRAALLALAAGTPEHRSQRMNFAEQQLKRLSSERGLEWTTMTEEERENFVDDLIHEDRPCLP